MKKQEKSVYDTVIVRVVLGAILLTALCCISFFVIWPCWKLVNALFWAETPAVVESGRIVSQKGLGSKAVYRLEVTYNYQYKGKNYHSSRYDLSSEYGGSFEVPSHEAGRYTAGREITCYVDPGNPRSAVIRRSYGRGYFVGLGGFAGLIAVVWVVGRRKSRKKRQAPRRITPKPLTREGMGNYALKPRSGGIGPLISTFAAVIIVNGMGTGLILLLRHDRGTPWFIGIFALLMGIFGIYLIFAFIRSLLNYLNSYVVEMAEPAVRLGGKMTLEWRLPKAVHMEKLVILLSCHESFTYQEGKHTRTITNLVHSQALLVRERPIEGHGTLKFTLPGDAMHSVKLPDGGEYYWTIGLYAWSGEKNYIGSDFTLPVMPKQEK